MRERIVMAMAVGFVNITRGSVVVIQTMEHREQRVEGGLNEVPKRYCNILNGKI